MCVCVVMRRHSIKYLFFTLEQSAFLVVLFNSLFVCGDSEVCAVCGERCVARMPGDTGLLCVYIIDAEAESILLSFTQAARSPTWQRAD